MSRRNTDAITIHSILDWIEDNLESPLSLEKVSERSGYSKWHLQRMFKKETGHSLGQYIRSRKMTEIAQKLKESNEPILYLAERYGFESQQTLTRTFKSTLLVMQSINLPFWLAAICSAFPMLFIQIWVKRSEKIIATETGSVWSPKVLLQDKALLWFTCSGFLASFVSGAFASCISQYVMVIADGDFAEKVVAVVLPVNAAMVVTLQYSVGRRLNPANIRALMTAGTLCFVIGLVGFIFSGNSLLMWGMSAAVFTVGEIIYAPGEYMLIDHIAPPGMKASYFSAQSLGWLGAAINPLVSGIVLTSLPPFSLFIILALVIVAAWVLMLKGIRARPWGQPALC